VLKVQADTLTAIDGGDLTCLVLRDLSAAFDTVNHEVLVKSLKIIYGVPWCCASLVSLIHEWSSPVCQVENESIVDDSVAQLALWRALGVSTRPNTALSSCC
jgi:hypothetical protein